MTDEERKALRLRMGLAYMDVQNHYVSREHAPSEVVPELIEAMVSLAWYLSKNNCKMEREDFVLHCARITEEDYEFTT